MEPIEVIYSNYAILTGYRSGNSVYANKKANHSLHNELKAEGYEIERSRGYYVHKKTGERVYEPGFIIYDIPLKKAIEFGKKYKQESIFYKVGGNAALYYTEEPNIGKKMVSFNNMVIGHSATKEQFYTKPATGQPFAFK